MALTDKLSSIGVAIREKTGKTDLLTLIQMPDEIRSIQGGISPTGSLSITSNGTYDVTEYASAEVNVSASDAPKIGYTVDANGDTTNAAFEGQWVTIPNFVFYQCSKLALTSLPSSITSIGENAFGYCKKLALTSLPSGITSIENYAFSQCSMLALTSLPSGITSIGNYAFSDCSMLALTYLPNGITRIGNYAFYYCYRLTLTSIPNSVTSIGTRAFCYCTGLTSITFEGKPNSIDSSAFQYCSRITSIKVPWSEGEVSGAPWGATNATITYNYTGE